MNFLESLVAEWHEYKGYFVRRNIRERKRVKGGWDIELDILAYMPSKQLLRHIETSSDASSWPERKNRFVKKKFILSSKEYELLIDHKVKKIEKFAIVGWAHSTKVDLNWGDDIKVILIPSLLSEITNELKDKDPMRGVVSESFPLLRAMQMALHYENKA